MSKTIKKTIQSSEGISDLNLLMNELTKNTPNKQLLKELTSKYGIQCNSDPKILMNDLICFLDRQKFEKLSDTEL